MENRYDRMAKVFRALSDPKRVKIVDMLSCGEMCACVLLKCFEITQPTLAHDMKVLTEAGVVISRRVGKNTFYSLNRDMLRKMDTWMKEAFRYDCCGTEPRDPAPAGCQGAHPAPPAGTSSKYQ